MPFFSVIIPNYNHASFLKERIDSVLLQSFQDFEVIIIDDGSTDKSLEIIKNYEEESKIARIIFQNKNSGSPFVQWKTGIEAAKGQWVWIAESDDFASPNFLSQCAECIQNNIDASLVYTDAYIVETENNFIKFSEIKNAFFKTQKWSGNYCIDGKAELNQQLQLYCTINNASSVVFKRKSSVDFLPHLAQFNYHGDWFFYIQMCLKGKVGYIAQPLNHFRNHGKSLLHSRIDNFASKKEHFIILRYLLPNLNEADKEKLIHFYTINYLGFGILKDGPINMYKLYKSYSNIDKPLATKVFKKLLKIKFNRQAVYTPKF